MSDAVEPDAEVAEARAERSGKVGSVAAEVAEPGFLPILLIEAGRREDAPRAFGHLALSKGIVLVDRLRRYVEVERQTLAGIDPLAGFAIGIDGPRPE
jgi:hypothetical protein